MPRDMREKVRIFSLRSICACKFVFVATEIQNIQIGDGDVPHNIKIPIYMIFPRLFTCPTLITPNFKIGTYIRFVCINFFIFFFVFSEFEVNVVVVFQNDHLITNNFPITLVRD